MRNLNRIRKFLDTDTCHNIVRTLILSKLDYCNSLLYGIDKKHLNRLQVLQNKCARLILKQPSRTHASPLLQSLHWLPIKKRILFKLIVQAFKAFQFSSPGYLAPYFQSRVHKTKYSLRSDLAITFEVPRAKKQAGDRAFSVAGPHLWNGLPSSVRTVDHMDRFKNKLKSHLFSWFFQAPWAHCKRRYINHIIIIIIILFINEFSTWMLGEGDTVGYLLVPVSFGVLV